MSVVPWSRPGEAQDLAQSWTISLLLHGLAIGGSVLLLSDLHLAPQPEPFRWVVSRIEPGMPAEPPISAQPSHPQPTMQSVQSRPVEVQPVGKPAEPSPSLQPAARQDMRDDKPVESPPVPARTIQPLATPPPQEAAPTESGALPPVTQAVAPAPSSTIATSSRTVTDAPRGHESLPLPSKSEPTESVKPIAPEPTVRHEGPVVASLGPALQAESPTQPGPAVQAKADYGWLGQMLRTRVEQLKHYPHIARANRWEGRVVLRAVIGETGQLVDLTVVESSGHSVLDDAALEVLKNAAPLTLPQPLGRSQVAVQVPISYRLR